jgi:hypothetical protein
MVDKTGWDGLCRRFNNEIVSRDEHACIPAGSQQEMLGSAVVVGCASFLFVPHSLGTLPTAQHALGLPTLANYVWPAERKRPESLFSVGWEWRLLRLDTKRHTVWRTNRITG